MLVFSRSRLLVALTVFGLAACQPAPEQLDSSEAAPEPEVEVVVEPQVPTVDPMADGVVTVAFIGDSLVDGIWGGYYRKFIKDKRFNMLRNGRNSTGLARPDFYDWQAGAEEVLAANQVDAAVITLGFNDDKDLYESAGRTYRYGEGKWDEIYKARITELVKHFKNKGIPTFWVGLPVVRDADYGRKIAHLNAMFKSQVEAAGATFIPLWETYMDGEGKYATHLKNANGRTKRIRAGDGIHFTRYGYDLIVEHMMPTLEAGLPVFNPDNQHAAK